MDDYPVPGCASDRYPLWSWRRWWNYDEQVWLIYVGFWFVQPYLDREPLRQWLSLVAIAILFIVMYVLAHRGPRRLKWFWALAMMALGLVYVPINQSACGIFIFVATTLSELSESPNVVISLLATEGLLISAECYFLHLLAWTWCVSVGFGFFLGMNRLRMNAKHRADAKLRMAQEEIERLAKTAERERIARDMHDVLGHSLSLIVLKSELAGHFAASKPEESAREIKEIETIARGALAEVRRTITGYRSEGFVAELTSATRALQAAGVEVRAPEKPPMLTARHEAMLSMVLREAVTNILRHARASECSIELSSAGAVTNLIIADNGLGNIRSEGNGLRGMRERVQELGGKLMLDSDRGTRLQIELPHFEVQPLQQ
jgi:two-component system sensor histidine kinase DesK